jgi:hypothetical protein
MQWSSTVSSNGRPVTVLQEILRFLQEDLKPNEAELTAREIIETIPNFVADPTEWIWSARIEWDGFERARAIMLEAVKPRHKWSHRIRLPSARN